jgi:hypothetical protein
MFSRHRVLFCVPIVLALVIAGWTVVGAAKSYQSSTSIWFDNAPPLPSSETQSDPTIRPPAAQRQLVLNELLGTRDFRLNIGRNGPLAAYLSSHPSRSSGPMALLPKLRGGATPLEERIVSALSTKQVTSTVLGPQVLSISVRSVSPAVAAGTLQALLDEFNRQENDANQAQAKAASTYYKDLADSASKAAAAAQSNINGYLQTHPVRADADPNLSTLTGAASAASAKLADANNNLNQATIALAHLSDTSALRILDKPNVPTGATGGGKKKLLLGVFAGLFAGALVSLLGLIALVAADKTTRGEAAEQDGSQEDVEDEIGLSVIGRVNRRPRVHSEAAPVLSNQGRRGETSDAVAVAGERAVAASQEVVGLPEGGPGALRILRPRARLGLRTGPQPQDD